MIYNDTLDIRIVENLEDIEICCQIREKVFVQEQNIPSERVKDEEGGIFTHFLMFDNDIPIGSARISFDNIVSKAYIERLCILKDYRKNGFGKIFMKYLVEYCKNQNFNEIYLSSQERVAEFYGKTGFKICSDRYMDSNIPHFKMQLVINGDKNDL